METPLSVLLKDKGYAIESITPDLSAYECALKLADRKVGSLLVIENGKLIGIVSERDILKKIVALHQNSKEVFVSAIMVKEVVTVKPTTTVQEAMRIVTEKRIRHLPVVDEGRLVGVISIGDLTRWVMLTQEKEISSLTRYIQGEKL
jgi:CBS domain-containing protein